MQLRHIPRGAHEHAKTSDVVLRCMSVLAEPRELEGGFEAVDVCAQVNCTPTVNVVGQAIETHGARRSDVLHAIVAVRPGVSISSATSTFKFQIPISNSNMQQSKLPCMRCKIFNYFI